MPQSSSVELTQKAMSVSGSPAQAGASGSTLLSVSGLTAAAIEGVCAGLVLLKGVALFSGLLSLMAAGASSWLHQDQVRIPLMALATAAALLNLYMVGNGWRLRRNPAAAWRVRPLTPAEKRRTALIVAVSLVTLALLAGEVWGHRVLHP